MTSKSPDAMRELLADFDRWQGGMQAHGVAVTRESFQGYDGFQCGGVFVGERDDGFLTRASGWQADLWFYIVPAGRWKATRLDLQVTGVFAVPQEDYARKMAQEAVSYRSKFSRGRPHRLLLTEGFGRGDSLTVGSRSSIKYGRMYDKHKESKGEYPQGAWRWELEAKQEAAVQAATALRAADDRQQLIASIVATFFVERGVHFPVDVPVKQYELHAGNLERSTEKSLRWLRTHVRPTVQRLLVDVGKSSIMDALGLTDTEVSDSIGSDR